MNNHESQLITGILYVVATPIGNLEDLTHRAKRILHEVDLIVCEDTRRTRILLDRYQIKTPMISYHQHSRLTKIDFIINQLKSGKNIALVSDAGTPGISDPGGVLISETVKQLSSLSVVPIPGPSALSTALSVCGFTADSFLFLGFLPKKKGRQTLFRNLLKTSGMKLYEVIVFYESPHRIAQTLKELQLSVGNYEVVIGRELTKQFEEIFRGKIAPAIEHFSYKEPKGEFTVVLRTTPSRIMNSTNSE